MVSFGLSYFKNKEITKSKEELSLEARAIVGDKKAFCSLIREHKLSLYRVARGILNNESDIEDALSNCILKAYKNIGKLSQEKFFKTWLTRILINECKNIIKKNKDYYIEDDKFININVYNDTYKDVDLQNALLELDERIRETIILYYYEDMKQTDIAKLLDINEATVRSRIFKGKEKLRTVLKDYNNEKVSNL
ncbi:RNA polymerase sigma factor [uncultured Clostridium sp.]|uniref:RNA polymerase sigma factor n=1 Tax=uncultured Clostridium sp. TaxID=59620 RepID=UPI00260FA17F|nr:sigma-70 family RNA polymerase sigma factor [uncultured Clostridium sp.]